MIIEVFTLALAGLAGALAHEGAHWLIWRLAGRDPSLDLWNLVVCPRDGPARTTAADRVAALAPYVLGVVSVGVGMALGSWPAIFFGLFAIQIPSTEDVATVRGRTRWRLAG